ncbi:MAG: Ldh family oxidoreductase [Lentisphaerae bacterium]|nr:Ldh family oxidoreductase [Lentisphaerota bacterium]
MSGKTFYLDFNTLESFMRDVFIAEGVPSDDAALCANVLITADKLGIDSHGIGRLKPIYIDRIRAGIQSAVTNVEFVRRNAAVAVVDAHDGMGMVAAKAAMDFAIDAAACYGLGMSVVRNSTHFGIAGYYPLMAVKKNMIGICGTNARPSIAPTFGVENMLGTNPLTFAIPTDEEFPFFLDCATSVSQRGKIEVYARNGKEIPPGWVIDSNGNTRTDTEQILIDLVKGSAALTPVGGLGEENAGYKGYGYATVVEILSAALQQGSFLKGLLGFSPEGVRQPYHLGHFFIAINIESFTSADDFKQITGSILRELRNSQKAPGCDRIYTAGEKEYIAYCQRQQTGVPVNTALQKEIIQLKNECKLSNYHFEFE